VRLRLIILKTWTQGYAVIQLMTCRPDLVATCSGNCRESTCVSIEAPINASRKADVLTHLVGLTWRMMQHRSELTEDEAEIDQIGL